MLYLRGDYIQKKRQTMQWSKFTRTYKMDNNSFAIYNYAWRNLLFVVNDLMDIVHKNINNILKFRK